jgi:sucrose-6-phosphate hydrolase SacC (GH32 family)
MFPSVQHPSRYVWDFWYYFDKKTNLYHIFYLNAIRELVTSETHHQASTLGHATTPDFIHIDWGCNPTIDIIVFPKKYWANASIWSGDIIAIKNGFLLFFTSRNQNQDDGMTQNIGVAYSDSLLTDRWQVTELRIQPSHCYTLANIPGDLSTHAWRDPFLFQDQGQIYMLVSAKSIDDPLGRNGVVGLLSLQDNDFSRGIWTYLDPIAQPSCYSEMEVPQLYLDAQGDYELVFSTWAKHDFSRVNDQPGGLQGFTGAGFRSFMGPAHRWISEQSGLYACRVIPELNGEIVGFDIQTGGIRRSGIKTQLRSVNRDFSRFKFESEI